MKLMKIITAALMFSALAFPGLAKGTADEMDHSGHLGKKIHETRKEGYRLAYHLMELDNGAGQHLMVYITGPDGKKIEGAKLGFLITGPGGSKQKIMAEGMKGAYGANADFSVVGAYLIKMKVVMGEKKLLDAFTYEIK